MSEVTNTEKNTISLETAQKWVKQWRKTCPDNCKAHLIPALDLTQVLKEMGILKQQPSGDFILDDSKLPGNGVRAYLAIDEDLVKEPGKGEKLVIVGTNRELDAGGKIVHRDIIYLDDAPMKKPEDSGIYDVTEPCPNNCDAESPLYNP
jgi:hypothetical protein